MTLSVKRGQEFAARIFLLTMMAYPALIKSNSKLLLLSTGAEAKVQMH